MSTEQPQDNNPTKRKAIIHLIATIKYRFNHAVSNASEEFWQLNPGQGIRKPIDILHHMRGLMYYAEKAITGVRTPMEEVIDVHSELKQFYESMDSLKEEVQQANLDDDQWFRMIQGPLSDALTHVGQLAMMRRMHGQPIPKQNFMRADIS